MFTPHYDDIVKKIQPLVSSVFEFFSVFHFLEVFLVMIFSFGYHYNSNWSHVSCFSIAQRTDEISLNLYKSLLSLYFWHSYSLHLSQFLLPTLFVLFFHSCWPASSFCYFMRHTCLFEWHSGRVSEKERLHLLIYCFTPKMTPVAKAVTNQRAWNFVWLSLQQEPNPTGLTSLPSQAHLWEAEQQAGQPEPEPALSFGMLVSQVTTYSAVVGCWSHLLLFFFNSFSPLVFIFLLLPVNIIIS